MGRVLLSHHGEQEWIFQIMDAVRAAVTNGVRRFTSAQLPAMNETPDGHYRFAARTREEILASQRDAAASGEVNPRSPFAHLMDPAKQLGGVEFEVDDDGRFGNVVEAPQPKPKKIIVPSSEEWAL